MEPCARAKPSTPRLEPYQQFDRCQRLSLGVVGFGIAGMVKNKTFCARELFRPCLPASDPHEMRREASSVFRPASDYCRSSSDHSPPLLASLQISGSIHCGRGFQMIDPTSAKRNAEMLSPFCRRLLCCYRPVSESSERGVAVHFPQVVGELLRLEANGFASEGWQRPFGRHLVNVLLRFLGVPQLRSR
jgi:hypothetical protein